MTRGARIALLAFGAFTLVLARYAPIVSEPIDGSIASWNLQSTARYLRVYEKAGFFEVRGIPQLSVLPTKPPTVKPYLHHPPGYPWLAYATVRVLGYSELGLRALPILFAALTGALLVVLLGWLGDLRWAAAGAALYLTSPMAHFFGWMPNTEALVLACMLLAFVLHERMRSAPPRRYAAVYAVFLAGTLLDWAMCFVAPALWLRELLEPAATRRLRRTLGLLPLGVASVAAVVALFCVWNGSVAALAETIRAASSALHSTTEASAPWLSSQARFWVDYFTWPVSILTAVAFPGVLRGALRRDDPLARMTLVAFVPASLNVLVFARSASLHDFWNYYAIPFAVLSNVWLLQRLPARRVLAPVLLAVCVVWGGAQILHLRRKFADPKLRERAAEMNRLAGPEDGITTPIDFGTESFYFDAWLLPPIADVETFRMLAERKRAGELQVRKIVAIVPERLDLRPYGAGLFDFTELAKALPAFGNARRIEHNDLKREAPFYASLIPPTPVWILTME